MEALLCCLRLCIVRGKHPGLCVCARVRIWYVLFCLIHVRPPIAAGNLPVLWSRWPKPVGLSAGKVCLHFMVIWGGLFFSFACLACAPCHESDDGCNYCCTTVNHFR